MEAMYSKDSKHSKEGEVEEMDSLDKSKTWEIVELLTRRKPINNIWVFKNNPNAKSMVEKYKDFLVEKRYYHVEGGGNLFCRFFC